MSYDDSGDDEFDEYEEPSGASEMEVIWTSKCRGFIIVTCYQKYYLMWSKHCTGTAGEPYDLTMSILDSRAPEPLLRYWTAEFAPLKSK